jgi:N-acetylneuraminic acid mutarotase
MNRLGKAFVLALIVAVVPAAALTASTPVPGAWHKLPAAPVAVEQSLTSVWTGRQLLVFGRTPATNPSVNIAEAYDPAAKTWTRLSPPAGPRYSPGYKAVWTGKEMLDFGPFSSVAFNPATNRWRPLRRSLPGGIVVWTGREAIGWGGGCCGDAWSNGAAYNPATDTFRNLRPSPLSPSQVPVGAWTGRELVLFVSGYNPDGKRYPTRFARAAAYNPATDTWRRITPLPAPSGSAIWDGHELLVVGGGAHSQSAVAYNPATNRWRRLASLPTGRIGAAAVWTGKRLLLWGGENARSSAVAPGGLAYDPRANRWSTIPPAPLKAREGSAVAWNGHALIVWGGEIGTPPGTSIAPKYPADGAVFAPTTP